MSGAHIPPKLPDVISHPGPHGLEKTPGKDAGEIFGLESDLPHGLDPISTKESSSNPPPPLSAKKDSIAVISAKLSHAKGKVGEGLKTASAASQKAFKGVKESVRDLASEVGQLFKGVLGKDEGLEEVPSDYTTPEGHVEISETRTAEQVTDEGSVGISKDQLQALNANKEVIKRSEGKPLSAGTVKNIYDELLGAMPKDGKELRQQIKNLTSEQRKFFAEILHAVREERAATLDASKYNSFLSAILSPKGEERVRKDDTLHSLYRAVRNLFTNRISSEQVLNKLMSTAEKLGSKIPVGVELVSANLSRLSTDLANGEAFFSNPQSASLRFINGSFSGADVPYLFKDTEFLKFLSLPAELKGELSSTDLREEWKEFMINRLNSEVTEQITALRLPEQFKGLQRSLEQVKDNLSQKINMMGEADEPKYRELFDVREDAQEVINKKEGINRFEKFLASIEKKIEGLKEDINTKADWVKYKAKQQPPTEKVKPLESEAQAHQRLDPEIKFSDLHGQIEGQEQKTTQSPQTEHAPPTAEQLAELDEMLRALDELD